MIELKLNHQQLPANVHISSSAYYGIPMLLQHKSGDEYPVVALTNAGGAILFKINAYMIFIETISVLEDAYTFLRFLTKDESVTFTGER